MTGAPELSALEPAGIQAARSRELFDQFLAITTVVSVLVFGAFVVAILLRRRTSEEPTTAKSETKRSLRVVVSASVLSAIILVSLVVMSVRTSHALDALPLDGALQIKLTGHRWWWEVEYLGERPDAAVRTAYELHVPVGRTIEIQLASVDVIHSLWVPNLSGKRDLIPGKPSTLLLRADRPGIYDGMCAEYCGTQHANMRIRIVAEAASDFEAWLARTRAPAREPVTDEEIRGRSLFLTGRCAACHAIAGTTAFARVGPDLTHVASRGALAMGTLANDDEHLAGWIREPNDAKPGVIMPESGRSPDEQRALVAYLRSLR